MRTFSWGSLLGMLLFHSRLISGPGRSSLNSIEDGGKMPGLGRTHGTSFMLLVLGAAGLEMLMR